MNECPYCGGDISLCDFDTWTDRCAEMERRLAFPTAADVERYEHRMAAILGDLK
jgi:hypothetical protein